MKEIITVAHHAIISFLGEEMQTNLFIRMDWVTTWCSSLVKLQRASYEGMPTLVFSGTIRIVEFYTRCKVMGTAAIRNSGERFAQRQV